MDNKYEIIIFWSSEDNAFVAEVPELSGCMADGKTYQEAIGNAEQIIEEWIETAIKLGRPIPQPKGRLAYAGLAMVAAQQWHEDGRAISPRLR